MKKLLLPVIAISILICACKKTAPPIQPVRPTLTIPPRTITVHTMLTHSRDTTVNTRDTATDFNTRDTIHGLIETENALNGTVLLGKWYYVRTGLLIAQSSATLSSGTNLSHFDLVNENPWPPGKYKLYVLVDSVLKDSAEFMVTKRR